MNERIQALLAAGRDAVAAASTSAALEEVRIEFLGRRAELPNLLRGVAELAPELRGPVGRAANEARRTLEAAIDARAEALAASELEARLAADRVDLTLPAAPLPAIGHLHLLTRTRREIEDIFIGLGFSVEEGPEVETVAYNFDALNHESTHPARLPTDTFYISDEVLLRTHTSPMQVRAMLRQPPPIFIVVPGRVYRRDLDATHTPQFHQFEGLAVDEDITLADLKGTLLHFSRAFFGPEREIRLRPHFFPFTEPSVEVDVSCFNCQAGVLPDGSRCPLCKGTAWIEILGAGMVDPNVLGYVAANGYDPERYQGFAFGMGIERLAMLKHGVTDLRLLYDND
ncbi:MAG TPA: phenylalanine--tRNA ligase subunit alpha, partial [Solirubrobacteraceae bacterium]|nr:phenylalanine--tRNA ligase subunit alpha [Solirubrobacteraceae bacterium]